MTFTCPKCRASIDAATVDVAMQAARCRKCRRLVDLSSQLGGSGGSHIPSIGATADGGAALAVSSARPPAPMPAKFQVEDGPQFRVRWRWFGPHHLFLVLFCLFWDGFLVLWYSAAIFALTSGTGGRGGAIAMLLFPLLHVAVGVGLTYFTLCGFVNTTTVEAGGGRLIVRHGPLPWRGNVDLDVATLEQLYSEEIVHRGKNGVSRTYDVSAVERDGVSRKILRGLESPAHALWLEQALESRLGITDREVGGELPR